MHIVVYIATSLDGYIADANGGLEWLNMIPAPEGDDLGFANFMAGIDVVVMGRVTFETVVGFGGGWPYPVPGLVLTSTLEDIPAGFGDHVSYTSGTPAEIIDHARRLGYGRLYIDGGMTIQRFLQGDLVDELIITEVPVLLGGGTPLFGQLDQMLAFEFLGSTVLAEQLLQKRFARKRT